jgi:hypothetical protein
MAVSQGLTGRLNLGYQGSQVNQVCRPKVRSAGGNDKERVLGLKARPAGRQGRHIAEAVAIEEQVIAPSDPSLDALDLLSKEGMKGVGDPDR